MLAAIHSVARTESVATCSLYIVPYSLTKLVFPSSSVEQSEEATGAVLGVHVYAGLRWEYYKRDAEPVMIASLFQCFRSEH